MKAKMFELIRSYGVQLAESRYGQERHADMDFAERGIASAATNNLTTTKPKKLVIRRKSDNKIIGEPHANALDAVRARAKLGDESTHSIVREDSDEALDFVSVSPREQQQAMLVIEGKYLSLGNFSELMVERIREPQGHKETPDPITQDSEEGNGRKKPQMGKRVDLRSIVDAILNRSKE